MRLHVVPHIQRVEVLGLTRDTVSYPPRPHRAEAAGVREGDTILGILDAWEPDGIGAAPPDTPDNETPPTYAEVLRTMTEREVPYRIKFGRVSKAPPPSQGLSEEEEHENVLVRLMLQARHKYASRRLVGEIYIEKVVGIARG